MNYKQEVIIQSLGPWMSERLFSLQQELMRAEISEPHPQTGQNSSMDLRGGEDEVCVWPTNTLQQKER